MNDEEKVEKKKTRHTIEELHELQAMPLELKVKKTCLRIREWVKAYGEDGVYVAFSGGKDSTVLLDIVRNVCGFKNIKAMFVDVPTQFPELKAFVQTFENVDIVHSKMGFYQVCEKYGFPLISKEVSEAVYEAKIYLTELKKAGFGKKGHIKYEYRVKKFGDENLLADYLNDKLKNHSGENNLRLARTLGWLTNDKDNPVKVNPTSEEKSRFNCERYRFFFDAPFNISNRCCNVMKKNPSHEYNRKTKMMPITAQTAAESQLRTQKWLMFGCNSFDAKSPISNPMSFWLENDVLEYIYKNDLPICSVYGSVVPITRQMTIDEMTIPEELQKDQYKTTGYARTGCALCGFGCHLEKCPSRFERLHETHPGMYKLLDVLKNNGVTFRQAIEWTNEHGNLNIRL